MALTRGVVAISGLDSLVLNTQKFIDSSPGSKALLLNRLYHKTAKLNAIGYPRHLPLMFYVSYGCQEKDKIADEDWSENQ